MRQAFGHRARGYEDQGGLMFVDGVFERLMDLFPDFVCHYRRERRFGQFDPEIQFASVPDIQNLAGNPLLR